MAHVICRQAEAVNENPATVAVVVVVVPLLGRDTLTSSKARKAGSSSKQNWIGVTALLAVTLN